MSKINVTICKNGNQKDSKPIFLTKEAPFSQFLKSAANKFKGLKAKRAFTENGDEISENDFQNPKIIYPNCKIIISAGEDYVGYHMDSKPKSITVGNLTSEISGISAIVTVIQKNSFIEPEAIKQLHTSAQMLNMLYATGLPDLHPGKDCPVGAAWASKDVFYPQLIGNDIGCGMSLYKTSIKNKRIKLETWADNLNGLESPWIGDSTEWLRCSGVEPTEHDEKTLGTIGGGNHFAELQMVEEVIDPEKFATMGLDNDYLYLLVHSGSRAFGEAILRNHIDTFGHKGLIEGTQEADNYIKLHDQAMAWAKCNRELIAHRFMECLTEKSVCHPSNIGDGTQNITSDGSICILDIWHNCVIKKEFLTEKEDGIREIQKLWLHRKGAAPSDVGPVVIPGSRGDFSYLVAPVDDVMKQQSSGYSLAHGAGRRLPRNVALKKGENMVGDLTTTQLGSKVICERKELLYEEIPDAYKDIQAIVQDLVEFGLIKVIAIFRPLITYKARVRVYEKVNHHRESNKE